MPTTRHNRRLDCVHRRHPNGPHTPRLRLIIVIRAEALYFFSLTARELPVRLPRAELRLNLPAVINYLGSSEAVVVHLGGGREPAHCRLNAIFWRPLPHSGHDSHIRFIRAPPGQPIIIHISARQELQCASRAVAPVESDRTQLPARLRNGIYLEMHVILHEMHAVLPGFT